MAKTYTNSGATSVPAPGPGDPAWFEVTVWPANLSEAVISGGVDFVWGGTTYDHSWLLRSAPIQGGSGDLGWQFIFRRPPSGSYTVTLHTVIEDGA